MPESPQVPLLQCQVPHQVAERVPPLADRRWVHRLPPPDHSLLLSSLLQLPLQGSVEPRPHWQVTAQWLHWLVVVACPAVVLLRGQNQLAVAHWPAASGRLLPEPPEMTSICRHVALLGPTQVPTRKLGPGRAC